MNVVTVGHLRVFHPNLGIHLAMTMQLDASSDANLLPEGKGAARLIVCEREGHWAVALRRELPVPRVRVYETRSVPECWEMLDCCPASFVVAELTRPNAKVLMARLARLGRDFPLARVAVVAERSLEMCEWSLREAGAVHFVVSVRQAGPLARLALRHLDAAPQPWRAPSERIWATLPWG